MPTIFDLLEKDHQKVKELFTQIEDSDEGDAETREKLFAQIKQELEVHTKFEEESFYPLAREKTGLADSIEDAYEEHAEAKTMLEELSEMESSEPEWMETISELADAIDHHVQDEESKLFPAARKAIDDRTAQDLAQQYQKMKQQAVA